MLAAIGAIMLCIVILILAYMTSRFLGKTWNRTQNSRYMTIIDQVAVGQDRALLIVRIQGQNYLLGSAGGSINLITKLDEDFQPDPDDELPTGGSGNSDFMTIFKDNLKKYTGTRGKRKDQR